MGREEARSEDVGRKGPTLCGQREDPKRERYCRKTVVNCFGWTALRVTTTTSTASASSVSFRLDINHIFQTVETLYVFREEVNGSADAYRESHNHCNIESTPPDSSTHWTPLALSS